MADLRIGQFQPAAAWLNTRHDSPEPSDPDCVCAFCGLVIGVAEDDPRWHTHNEDTCDGCVLCEQPIRLWHVKEWAPGDPPRLPNEVVRIEDYEMRFHTVCFSLVLER